MNNRSESVIHIIKKLLAARARGEEISDEAVLAAHPELHDLLNEALSNLRHVETTEPAPGEVSPHFPTVPGYLVVDYIGGGGQASVYEGVMLSTSRRVAIKVLHGGQFSTEESKARFLREKETLARISHRNIVSILDRIVTPDGHDCLIMDYVKGITLKEYLLRTTSDIETAIRSRNEMLGVFIKTAQAVGAAHRSGIVHRDLKPSNIQLDMEGEPFVLDFGLAKSMPSLNVSEHDSQTADEPVTITGQFVGSLPWASPEQVAGEAEGISTRSDVYSLGVILYQIITAGAFPYQTSGSMVEAFDRILRQTPASPTLVLARRCRQGRGAGAASLPPSSIEPAIESVVLRALSKRPETRYADANELADALERAMKASSPQVQVDATEGATPNKQGTTRLRLGVTLLVLLTLAMFMWIVRNGTRSGTGSPASNETLVIQQHSEERDVVDMEQIAREIDPVIASQPVSSNTPVATAPTEPTSSVAQAPTTGASDSSQTNTALPRQLRVPAEYPTIEEAITDAVEGDRILVSPTRGGYRERLTITRNITLQGEGSTQIDLGSDRGTIITVQPKVTATFENFAFAPSEADGDMATSGVFANDSVVTLTNCRFSGFSQAALNASTSRLAITSCVFDESNKTGIESIGSDIKMSSCTFRGCRTYGVWIRDSGTVEIRSCTFQDTTGIGLLTDCSKPSPLTIEDCDFNNNSGGGAQLGGAVWGSVRGGTYSSNGKFGLNVRRVEAGLVIAGVIATGTIDGDGIRIAASKRVTLENSKATHNPNGAGCRVHDASTDVTVIGGDFSRNKDGIVVRDGSSVSTWSTLAMPLCAAHNEDHGLVVEQSEMDVVGGVFEHNGRDGISAHKCKNENSDPRVKISRNAVCQWNTSQGIRLVGSSAKLSEGVACINNEGNGLLVDFQSVADVEDCIFKFNKHSGIYAGQPNTILNARKNNCEKSENDGIVVVNTAADGIIDGNTCRANGNSGILIISGKAEAQVKMKILNNYCIDNKRAYGIWIDGIWNRTEITKNRCEGNALGGIAVSKGSRAVLQDNACTGNLEGILCCDPDSTISLFGKNQCNGNTENGLHIRDGGSCTGSGISFATNGKCDIRIGRNSKARCNQIAPQSQRRGNYRPTCCDD